MKRFRAHHLASSAPLARAHPFLAGDSLGQCGMLVGRDAAGGLVFFDPFELYASRALSGPDAAVTRAAYGCPLACASRSEICFCIVSIRFA